MAELKLRGGGTALCERLGEAGGGSDGVRAGRAGGDGALTVGAGGRGRRGGGDPDGFGMGGDGLGDGGTEDRAAGGGRAAVSGDETGGQVGKVPSPLGLGGEAVGIRDHGIAASADRSCQPGFGTVVEGQIENEPLQTSLRKTWECAFGGAFCCQVTARPLANKGLNASMFGYISGDRFFLRGSMSLWRRVSSSMRLLESTSLAPKVCTRVR